MIHRHAALNRFPLKQAADTAALLKIFVAGNVCTDDTIGFSGRVRCLQFYFSAYGVNRMHVGTARYGTLWSEFAMALAIDMVNGSDGEYVQIGVSP